MPDSELEQKWISWMDTEGGIVDQEIEEEFRKNFSMFDMADGTHAKWIKRDGELEEALGVLVVFTPEELSDLLCAWDDAQGGNMVAGSFVAGWLGHFMEFMERASDGPVV